MASAIRDRFGTYAQGSSKPRCPQASLKLTAITFYPGAMTKNGATCESQKVKSLKLALDAKANLSDLVKRSAFTANLLDFMRFPEPFGRLFRPFEAQFFPRLLDGLHGGAARPRLRGAGGLAGKKAFGDLLFMETHRLWMVVAFGNSILGDIFWWKPTKNGFCLWEFHFSFPCRSSKSLARHVSRS